MTLTSASTKSDKVERIRYAQLWEDADVLTDALGSSAGKRLLSISAAGDNALALLTLDPQEVVALDLSFAQIACLHLRIGAMQSLSHDAFLGLMGARPAQRREPLLDQALKLCLPEVQHFWQDLAPLVARYGAGGVGKFERYFRLFRTLILPLTQQKRTVDAIFEPRDVAGRQAFLETRFDNWRWRLLMRLFFSKAVMGHFGRDPTFFAHAEGSLYAHLRRRIYHAAVTCDPASNPYLHWIVKGTHGTALPLPWRAEFYNVIRSRLDRLSLHHGTLEAYLDPAQPFDGFNLSDIFEYLSLPAFSKLYGQVLAAANPGARLVYWNMMVPRRVPEEYQARVLRRQDIEDRLKPLDKAFFYSDFVVEEVR